MESLCSAVARYTACGMKIERWIYVDTLHSDLPVGGSVRRGPRSGALALFCPHTTCGLTINEGADPDVCRDMEGFFRRLVPQDPAFAHAEGNSDAHIKCTLHGPSLLVLVEDGELRLGTWQAIYLCEGDGPRRRSVWAQWLPGPR